MELCVSGVNLRFDNPSMKMEEDGDNVEGVLQICLQMKKRVKVKGQHQQTMKSCHDFDPSKLSMKLLIRLKRSASSHLKNPPLIPRHLKMKHEGKIWRTRSPPSRRMIHRS